MIYLTVYNEIVQMSSGTLQKCQVMLDIGRVCGYDRFVATARPGGGPPDVQFLTTDNRSQTTAGPGVEA